VPIERLSAFSQNQQISDEEIKKGEINMETKLAKKGKPNILDIMSAKYNLDPVKFKETIKATVMRPGKDGRQATDEEFMAFLMVANKYDLDPFTNEIYAFPAKKGGIVPVIGVDGYVRKICNHAEFDGMETSFSEDEVTPEGGKVCPEWCEVRLYRKGVSRPIIVREYIDEVYRPAFKSKDGYESIGPWQTHTKRMLRHKTIIQAGRVAGFLIGVYDEDEAQRIIEAEIATEPIKPSLPIQPEAPVEEKDTPYKAMLEKFVKAKEVLGKDEYYKVMGQEGYEHANQIRLVIEGERILGVMRKRVADLNLNGKGKK